MDKDLHKVVPTLYLPLFSEMPSQQGIFPKRSLGRNPKIDHFSPTTKPHPLSPLTEGLPLLYWLGTRGWCSDASVCVPLPSAFVFFYSYAIFVILAMSHSTVCLLCSCLSFTAWRMWALRLVLLPLVMPMGLLVVILAMLAHYAFYLFSWAFKAHLLYLYLLLCIWAYWLPFMLCWPIGLFTFFLRLLRPIYFTFTL